MIVSPDSMINSISTKVFGKVFLIHFVVDELLVSRCSVYDESQKKAQNKKFHAITSLRNWLIWLFLRGA